MPPYSPDRFANFLLAPFEVEDVELGSFDGIESDNNYEKTQNLHFDSDEDEDQEQALIVDDNFDSMQKIPIITSSRFADQS